MLKSKGFIIQDENIARGYRQKAVICLFFRFAACFRVEVEAGLVNPVEIELGKGAQTSNIERLHAFDDTL